MKHYVLLIAVLLFFVSCDNTLHPLLTRTQEDPFDDVPIADSFTTAKTVYLHWKEDAAADEYILMRANDDINPVFSVIYRGTETSHVDRALSVDDLYIYRLDKKRGDKYFAGTTTAMGVYSELIKDRYEPNNDIEGATLLDYKCESSIYVYKFSDGRYLEDVDWYKVVLPARRSASIKFAENELDTGFTSFYYSQSGVKGREILKQNESVSFVNYSDITKIVYFRIFPNRDSFLTLSRQKSYVITLDEIF